MTTLTSDKIWRVRLAVVEFVTTLVTFLDKDVFKTKLQDVIVGMMNDNVFAIREQAAESIIALSENYFDLYWLEQSMEKKLDEFARHEKFMMRIHCLFFCNKV